MWMMTDAMLTGMLPVVTYIVRKKTFWLPLHHAHVTKKVTNNLCLDEEQLLSGGLESVFDSLTWGPCVSLGKISTLTILTGR